MKTPSKQQEPCFGQNQGLRHSFGEGKVHLRHCHCRPRCDYHLPIRNFEESEALYQGLLGNKSSYLLLIHNRVWLFGAELMPQSLNWQRAFG